jgi:hypothetical protein
MIRAALATAPPLKPVRKSRTNQLPRVYFTIHSHPNDAFTLKISDKTRTSIVGFKDIDDAIYVGRMIETHFIRQKEWPDTRSVGTLVLPPPQTGDVLQHVYVQKWEFDELKVQCTRNFLDLISVDALVNTKKGYSFSGNAYRFDAKWDYYRDRIGELYGLGM